MRYLYLIFFTYFSVLFSQESDSLIQFNWNPYSDTITIAKMKVPPGYKLNTWAYGEGFVSTLLYPDSSLLTLHTGFTMSLPLLKSPEYLVYGKEELKDKTTRHGRVQNTLLLWREDNYKYKFPVNVAYSNVPKTKITLFEKSLDSFKWIK